MADFNHEEVVEGYPWYKLTMLHLSNGAKRHCLVLVPATEGRTNGQSVLCAQVQNNKNWLRKRDFLALQP